MFRWKTVVFNLDFQRDGYFAAITHDVNTKSRFGRQRTVINVNDVHERWHGISTRFDPLDAHTVVSEAFFSLLLHDAIKWRASHTRWLDFTFLLIRLIHGLINFSRAICYIDVINDDFIPI